MTKQEALEEMKAEVEMLRRAAVVDREMANGVRKQRMLYAAAAKDRKREAIEVLLALIGEE